MLARARTPVRAKGAARRVITAAKVRTRARARAAARPMAASQKRNNVVSSSAGVLFPGSGAKIISDAGEFVQQLYRIRDRHRSACPPLPPYSLQETGGRLVRDYLGEFHG